MTRHHRFCLGLVISGLFTAACATAPSGSTGREPGDAPMPTPTPAPATSGTAPGSIPYTRADVSFMQGMILHHAQALEMTRLVPDRTKSRDLGLLARRISESQDYEIDLMGRWLSSRGESVPAIGGPGAAAHDGMGTMAGMATPEQMARLADSKNIDFERMFLELMIRHHEGALTMLDDLGKTEGAGQEPELFQLISHVDADQRAEIARMRRMLNELQ